MIAHLHRIAVFAVNERAQPQCVAFDVRRWGFLNVAEFKADPDADRYIEMDLKAKGLRRRLGRWQS